MTTARAPRFSCDSSVPVDAREELQSNFTLQVRLVQFLNYWRQIYGVQKTNFPAWATNTNSSISQNRLVELYKKKFSVQSDKLGENIE